MCVYACICAFVGRGMRWYCLICNFYLSVSARKLVGADPLACCILNNQQASVGIVLEILVVPVVQLNACVGVECNVLL